LTYFALMALSLPGDWDPRLAAKYLDARQQEWFAWPAAKAVTGGTCLSCHTGATYLLARPALRRVLGETGPTSSETVLLDGLRSRAGLLDAKEIKRGFTAEPVASQALGVEAVFAALFLSQADDGAALDADAQKAFDRLWLLQARQGAGRGAWPWFNLNADPYEMPPSPFYGATLAALAAGNASAEYRKQPKVQERIAELNAYFAREREAQPLHSRLMLLWASTKLPDALPEASRKATIEEIWERQEADCGWTIKSLGPWTEHQAASADPADPMNKLYAAGSMQSPFMQDTATAFAALALSKAWGQGPRAGEGAAGRRGGRAPRAGAVLEAR
jgi:squalene-hopene/tetraprenyl-beta-curcumene cyclase